MVVRPRRKCVNHPPQIFLLYRKQSATGRTTAAPAKAARQEAAGEVGMEPLPTATATTATGRRPELHPLVGVGLVLPLLELEGRIDGLNRTVKFTTLKQTFG